MNQQSTITPALDMKVEIIDENAAKAFLQLSGGNRPISAVAVDKYYGDLTCGRFQLNGESIKFDWDGKLIDGHHRLIAIIKAAMAVPMVVIRGLDPASVVTMDNGRSRSASDQLSMFNKVTSAGHKVSIARQVLAIERGLTRGNRLSSTEIQENVLANLPAIEKAHRIAIRAKERIKGNVTVFGSAHVLISQINSVAADEFFERLIVGVGLHECSPILAARNSLMTDRRLGGYQARQIETIFRAWNFWREGRERKFIRVSGEYPKLAA